MNQGLMEQEDYWRREMPTSPGRVLLIGALARMCLQRHGHALDRVALTFDEDGTIFVDEPARSQILGAARMLGEACAAGDVATHVRAFGGSVPSPLPPTAWEIDDFEQRFASSAIDPSRPFEPGAVPTHWIFVDRSGLERLIRSEATTDQPADGAAPPVREGPEGSFGQAGRQSDRYVRMPELQTMTGLSRATIYRRIESGRFPGKVPMDGNVSVWRESEVADWIANPR
ncbi:hypothetical protein GCM10011380_31350 [Sphingomonas metalli]|uniref:AlpA family phage regulatory protein n=1 Tax=Sphingomonas metalli TaxID=1779358 RepID=A0A916TC25_9SPHN|nr:AlpA family phage regulatory protein [Sphingomonas metalli]GGB39561.1 hypothetical protein GCM10011380_31350 [Sphingomonas metalli]